METLGSILALVALVAAITAVVVIGGRALGIDWQKPSDFGRSKAPPPPIWLVALVALILFIVGGIVTLGVASPAR